MQDDPKTRSTTPQDNPPPPSDLKLQELARASQAQLEKLNGARPDHESSPPLDPKTGQTVAMAAARGAAFAAGKKAFDAVLDPEFRARAWGVLTDLYDKLREARGGD